MAVRVAWLLFIGCKRDSLTPARPHCARSVYAAHGGAPYNGAYAQRKPAAAGRTRYSALDPECVLDALDSVGLRGDGRLLALNSYENRVYQVGIEDGRAGRRQVLPARRAGATPQILEEHALRRRSSPSARSRSCRRWRSTARTLHAVRRLPLRRLPRHGGRAPELDDPDTLRWIGPLHRPHPRGRRAAAVRAAARARHRRRFGDEPRDFLLAHDFVPPDCARPGQRRRSRRSTACGAATTAPATCRCCACTATATPATCCGPTPARTSSTSTTPHGPGGAGPVDAAVGRSRRHGARSWRDVLAGYEDFCDFDPRELHLVEALRTLRLIHYAAWLARRWDDPGLPGRLPVVQHAALLAGPHPRAARAGRADGRAAAVAGLSQAGNYRAVNTRPCLAR